MWKCGKLRPDRPYKGKNREDNSVEFTFMVLQSFVDKKVLFFYPQEVYPHGGSIVHKIITLSTKVDGCLFYIEETAL